jgi:hypothetical protein
MRRSGAAYGETAGAPALDLIERVAAALLKHEELDGDEIDAVIEGGIR